MRDRPMPISLALAVALMSGHSPAIVRAAPRPRLPSRRDLEPRVPAQRLAEVAQDARVEARYGAGAKQEARRTTQVQRALSGAYGWQAQQDAWDTEFPLWRGLAALVCTPAPDPRPPEDRAFLDDGAARLRANGGFLMKPWQALLRAYRRNRTA